MPTVEELAALVSAYFDGCDPASVGALADALLECGQDKAAMLVRQQCLIHKGLWGTDSEVTTFVKFYSLCAYLENQAGSSVNKRATIAFRAATCRIKKWKDRDKP